MLRSVLMGLVAGQRAMTPLAALAGAAQRDTLPYDNLEARLMKQRVPTAGAVVMAAAEMAGDKMKTAPDRLQWTMNTCLAQIGIAHPEHRARAVAIGERLEVLKDYPTPPNCTSPFAPAWITEMVSRQTARA